MAHNVLRLPALKTRTGLSRSSIYKFVAEGRFPQPVRLGVRSVGWLEAEIDEWLRNRMAARATKLPSASTHRELESPTRSPRCGGCARSATDSVARIR